MGVEKERRFLDGEGEPSDKFFKDFINDEDFPSQA